jgi:hypothetical protein
MKKYPIADIQDLIERVIADNSDDSGCTTIVLEPRTLDVAIVGFVEVDGRKRLAYDEELLIMAFQKDMKCTMEEAYDWFSFNTVRGLPYMESEGAAPVIIYK